ncbi:N-6 DNA methylase [Reyranella sp.]|uniref:class I SAM-dependent DNA methyltransferase n=1 Tax=Reyranella sp. TaxID=1929291 RepID=UPI00351E31C1
MFLKFLDDLEVVREDEATLATKRFRPAIEAPYRWRDWAANQQGITGDELLSFINQDEAVRPDGVRGPGLFAYLRSLSSSNGDNRRDVIATVFRGVDNRMKSGYLLRDVINKIGSIHFTSSAELHTLGALYESMLREMRDAAGDSGEFYTPRAVVRLMVELTDPRVGEVVLDPASGTGGFLVEAFNHLSKQVRTVGDRKKLQQETLYGCEPKSLPYLLCQMNLLLHGLDAPQIDGENALRFKLSEIGEKDRVDIVLTNPPFGGEEERGIQGNFPEDRQTAETALLFLQLIMRKLRRQPTSANRKRRLSELLRLEEDAVRIQPEGSYPQVGLKSFGAGLFSKAAISGTETTYRAFNRLYDGAVVLSQVKGWEGAVAVCPKNLADWFVSPEYRTFRCIEGEARPRYLAAIVRTKWFWSGLSDATRGVGARRERTRPEQFLNIEIPMPDARSQEIGESVFAEVDVLKRMQAETAVELEALLPSILDRAFKREL